MADLRDMLKLDPDSPTGNDMSDQMVGQGKFRDTGRRSSGPGESLDSIIGAPARVAVQEAQKGNLSWDAVKRIFSQIGADPRTAPTGYDIASKVTNDPIIGTMLATAVDFGAQMPGLPHITPGVMGEVRGVKNMGNVADALEAFAERGKAPLSTETKIAQMNGATGEVRDAMPTLTRRAQMEHQVAQKYGVSMDDPQAKLDRNSAYDNPRNAPPAPEEIAVPEAKKYSPDTIWKVKSDNFDGHLTGDAYQELRNQMSSGDFGSHKAQMVSVPPKGEPVHSYEDVHGEPPPDLTSPDLTAPETKPFTPSGKYDAVGENLLKPTGDQMLGVNRDQILQDRRTEAQKARDQEWEQKKQMRAKGATPRAQEIADQIKSNEESQYDYHYHDEGGDYEDNLRNGGIDLKNVGRNIQPLVDDALKAGVPKDKITALLNKHSEFTTNTGHYLDPDHVAYSSPGEIETQHDDIPKDLTPEEHAYLNHQVGGDFRQGNAWTYNSMDDVVHTLVADPDKVESSLSKLIKKQPTKPELISRKPDSLSATTMLDPGAAAGAAGIQPAKTREEKIAFLQAQQAGGGDQPATTREQKIAFLQAKANGSKPNPQGIAQTAVEGFGNGVGLGYLPQLQAAAAGPIYAGLNAVTGQNIQPDSYVDERDHNIARIAQQRADNPYTSIGSGVGGAVASGIAAAPMLPARAATISARLLQAGRIGGLYAGLANPGDTAGQVDPVGSIPQRLDNAAKGAALAAGTAGVIEAPGIAKSALQGTQQALAGKVGRGVEFTPAANRAEVLDAARTAGVSDVPKAVLTDNPTFQKLESGLSQSGSMPADSIRDQYTKFFKSLEQASKKVSDLKTNDSDFALGKNIQGSMARQVEDAKAPVSEMYNELTPHLRKIDVNEDVVNKAFGALKRNPLFQNQQGKAMLEEYKASTLEQPELASLKEFRSTLRDSVGPSSSPLDAKRMDAIASAVTSIRDNTINALKEHMPDHMHPEVDNLISDISLADAAHKSNLDDLNSVKSLIGNKPVTSQSAFLKNLSNLKESDLADRASNLDVTTLRNLQGKFPQVFDKAKTAIVNDMVKTSTSSVNGFNDTAFLKKYDGLDQEMKDLIFDPKMQSHIEAVKTLKQAIPDKLGASGTPEGIAMMQRFDPRKNALDYGLKKTLEASSNKMVQPAAGQEFSDVLPQHSPGKTALQLILSRPSEVNQASAQTFQKAASNPPLKGQDKWANDGAQKLIDHAPDDKATIEKAKGAMSDPKVKALLIQASDLKPNTPAMTKVMSKLKSQIASGDE